MLSYVSGLYSNFLKPFRSLMDGLTKMTPWWIGLPLALCAIALGAQWCVLDGHGSAMLADIQFAANAENARAVLNAWASLKTPIGSLQVGLALGLDFLYIVGYVLLLDWLISYAPTTRVGGVLWQEHARNFAISAGLFHALGDLLTLFLVCFGLDFTGTAFIFFSIRAFLLGGVWIYIAVAYLTDSWFQGFWQSARVCGFSLFASIAAPALLSFGNQGAAIFSNLWEQRAVKWWSFPLSVLGTLFFSLMCWGAARYATYKDGQAAAAAANANPAAAAAVNANPGSDFGADWIPRFCGVVPGLLVACNIPAADLQEQGEAFWIGFWMIFVSVIMSSWLWLHFQLRKSNSTKWKNIDTNTYKVVTGLGIAAVAVWCVSPSWLQRIPVLLGPLASWFVSFSLAVPFFTFLITAGRSKEKPFLAVAIAWAILCNVADLNDDHAFRHRYRLGVHADESKRLNEAFDNWLHSVGATGGKGGAKPYPVLFVAAEGGGIVAGANLTVTLAELDARINRPNDHLFAISSVSGGSIGAATYAVLHAPGSTQKFAGDAERVLTSDMLSPTVASLLGPELVQRFLPFAVQDVTESSAPYAKEFAADRGRALDLAFERAIGDGATTNIVKVKSFISDYPAPKKDGPPALFLNTTNVETGERMVISTLLPDEENKAPREGYFPLPFETLSDVDPRVDPPLTSAACLSARFPIVSPPAYISQVRETRISGETATEAPVFLTVKRRYVDGGYYENSGVQTAMDVIDALQREDGARPGRCKWQPVLLVEHRGDETTDTFQQNARGETRSAPDKPRAESPRRSVGFDEILGPIDAFFTGWGGPARPEQLRARRRLRDSTTSLRPSNFVELIFPRPAILSWYLSKNQYKEISEDAGAPANQKAWDRMVEIFGAAPAPVNPKKQPTVAPRA